MKAHCFNVGAIEWHIYACIENLDAFQLARLVAHKLYLKWSNDPSSLKKHGTYVWWYKWNFTSLNVLFFYVFFIWLYIKINADTKY